ncbi:hypothetical protein CK203_045479 [Vitis vinifera]|uniref:Uncharacterized protein n=1 Tax=Vitis vinifera TaxID=29760 RepID=A0A438HXX7_VITVI|nr:hypothetical protein CK203_045479 [Vitis vinifera]
MIVFPKQKCICFLLTSSNIFEEPIWEKEGLWPPCCRSWCQWSSCTSDLPIAGRGCTLFFKFRKYNYYMIGCIMQLLHASISLSGHQH